MNKSIFVAECTRLYEAKKLKSPDDDIWSRFYDDGYREPGEAVSHFQVGDLPPMP